jgi:hypothetical protein
MSDNDQHARDSQRVQLLGGLSGEVMVYQPLSIHQISKGGMEIETGFALHLDSLHDFRLSLGDRSIVVKGRIAHSHISDVDQDVVRYRSGIEFIEPSERVLAVIDEFLDLVRRSQLPR